MKEALTGTRRGKEGVIGMRGKDAEMGTEIEIGRGIGMGIGTGRGMETEAVDTTDIEMMAGLRGPAYKIA